jgi:hypothetical protein
MLHNTKQDIEFHKRIRRIANSLSSCLSVQNPDSRRVVLSQLPFGDKIENNNQTNVHVFNIVKTAVDYRRGLETLVEVVSSFEGKSIPMQRVYDTLDNEITLPIKWSRISSLKGILAKNQFEEDSIRRFYYQSSRSKTELPEWCNDDLLECCIEELAKQPHKAPNVPLPEFLINLLSEIEEVEIKDEIENWIKSAIVEMDITFDEINRQVCAAQSDLPAADGSPYLLVKVEPDQWKENEYQIKGWFLYNNKFKLLSVPDASCSVDDFPKLLEELIFESKQRLVAEFKKPASEIEKLIIEVFLPIDLLSSNLDEWKLKVGKFTSRPIGHFSPLVIRSFERVYDEDLRVQSWGRWRQKWESRSKTLTSTDIYSACAESDYCDRFFDKLTESSLIFLGLTLIPPRDSNLQAIEILGPMLDAGIPIALWLRSIDDNNVNVIRAEIEELIFNNNLDQIPDLVRSKRHRTTNQSFWKSITLLWDDPDRLPPDVQFNLSAP